MTTKQWRAILSWPAQHLRTLVVALVIVVLLDALTFASPLLGAAVVFGALLGLLIGVFCASL